MLKRIELILQTQNLTVSQFADRIGVQRSALSHVLGGRNNPSLDFVTKILRTFPEIRSQWLLFGEGKMYDGLADISSAVSGEKTEAVSDVSVGLEAEGEVETVVTVGLEAGGNGLLDGDGKAETAEEAEAKGSEETAWGEALPEEEPAVADRSGLPADFGPVRTDNPRLIKVVFFYSDGRFEEYARR